MLVFCDLESHTKLLLVPKSRKSNSLIYFGYVHMFLPTYKLPLRCYISPVIVSKNFVLIHQPGPNRREH